VIWLSRFQGALSDCMGLFPDFSACSFPTTDHTQHLIPSSRSPITTLALQQASALQLHQHKQHGSHHGVVYCLSFLQVGEFDRTGKPAHNNTNDTSLTTNTNCGGSGQVDHPASPIAHHINTAASCSPNQVSVQQPVGWMNHNHQPAPEACQHMPYCHGKCS
jgi:hypothetical protein